MQLNKKTTLGFAAAAVAFASAAYVLTHREPAVEAPFPDLDARAAELNVIMEANRAKPCGKDASLVVLRNPDMTCPTVK